MARFRSLVQKIGDMQNQLNETSKWNWEDIRVVVTGGAGFLGRAVCRGLERRNCGQIIVPRRNEYDLTSEEAARQMYADFEPDVVIHLAAEVGGIGANRDQPGRFFYANAAMGLHLIEFGRQAGIRKFVQVGTVCAYPKFAELPFREDGLWDGFPEETNAPYGIAKKSLFVMLDAYYRQYGMRSAVVVPVNLYGPNDNFDRQTSHVIPALIRKCVEAVERGDDRIACWGTGKASREFLYVDDAAEAVILATERVDCPTPVNLGSGNEITIRDLCGLIAPLCDFTGAIEWDPTKPDGQPRRRLDVSRAWELLGWRASVPLEEGLRRTICWYHNSIGQPATSLS